MIDEEIRPVAAPGHEARHPPAARSPPAPAERWVAEHGDVLWRFVLARTRSREVAEEVVQDTILAAMQGHAGFAGASSERTWLLGIAAHKVADHFRGARRRAGIADAKGAEDAEPEGTELREMFTAKGMWAKPPRRWGAPTDNAPDKAELLAALRRCVEALPPPLAEAVWRRDLLNTPAREVCKAMGLTPSSLWSRMHRARAALRLCVEKSMGIGKEGAE